MELMIYQEKIQMKMKILEINNMNKKNIDRNI